MKFLKYYILLFAFIIFCQCNMLGQNKRIDSLNLLLKKSNLDTNSLNLYKKLCDLCDISENLKYGNAGLDLTNKLLSSVNDLKFRKQLLKHKVGFIQTISVYYEDKKNYDNRIKNNQLLYPIYKELNDTGKIEETYAEIAHLLLESGNTTSAFDSLMLKLKYYETKNINRFIAFYQLQIADSYNWVNNPNKALEYYIKSLNTYTILKRKDRIAPINLKMAEQYSMLGQPKKSLECAFNVLKMNEKTNSPEENHWIYWRIASNYTTLREFDLALKYDTLCLETAKKTNELGLISNAYSHFASAFGNAGRFEEEEFYEYKSLEIIKKTDNTFAIMLALDRISRLNLNLKKYGLSIKYALEGSKIAEDRKDINMLMRVNYLLFKSYQLKKNPELALKHHINFILFKDSLKNIESLAELNQRETKYAFEKKEEKRKIEQEKIDIQTAANKRNQQLIIFGVASILLIVLIFSTLLFKRFKITNKQKEIIEAQKHLVEEKHKEITDSINYAERIQRSFLATKQLLDENLASTGSATDSYFVFFQPKDIVSGDFYWASKLSNGNFALVTADSTGHGVPGAIMSLLNITSLESALKDGCLQPSEILNDTRKTIIKRLKKDGSPEGGKDGMDASLICFDFKNNKFSYSAANNPIWIVRENQILELVPDKMPVGKHDRDYVPFTQHEIDLQKGDVVYTLTDGMPDQFGGPLGKKYMYKRLKELLISIAHLPIKEQKETLQTVLNNWKGDLEQVDDVCVIGIKI